MAEALVVVSEQPAKVAVAVVPPEVPSVEQPALPSKPVEPEHFE